MTKIVINTCYGGFGLSSKALDLYNELSGKSEEFDWEIPRNDPYLVQVVETLGEKANGSCADLVIKDIPAGTLYRIDEYDGAEYLETADSIEWSVA